MGKGNAMAALVEEKLSAAAENAGRGEAIASKNRVIALDVLRGLALFGILVVNAQQMFQPFLFAGTSYANEPVAILSGEPGVIAHWAIIHTFFESKFLTLFSLLFGIGFALQFSRAARKGISISGTYLRRLAVLAVFGALHAVFLYPADVLFIYAVTGTAFFFMAKNWSAALLLQVGLILFLASMRWSGVLDGLGTNVSGFLVSVVLMIATVLLAKLLRLPVFARILALLTVAALTLAIQIAPQADQPIQNTLGELQQSADIAGEALRRGEMQVGAQSYALPLTAEAIDEIRRRPDLLDADRNALELSIMRNGPDSAYRERGLSTLLLFQLFGVMYLYWRTFAVFAIGAALWKWFAADDGKRISGPAMLVGLGAGIPISIAATWFKWQTLTGQSAESPWQFPLHELSALLIALGLVGLVLFWVAARPKAFLVRNLAALGRTALSNYIGQSALLAILTTSYGLSLAGEVGRWHQFGYCMAIFLVLTIFSRIWLSVFEYGPLEWIWRSLTYAKPAILLRRR